MVDGGFIDIENNSKGFYGYSAYSGNGVCRLFGAGKSFVESAEESGLTCILKGLERALKEGRLKDFVISDSKTSINAIKDSKFVLHRSLREKVKGIQKLCASFVSINFDFASRSSSPDL